MSREENEAETTRNRRRSYARAFRAHFHNFFPLSPTNRQPLRLVITFTTQVNTDKGHPVNRSNPHYANDKFVGCSNVW